MGAIRTDEEWKSIILDCRASGLPDKDWCREHDISTSSFYYNLRKLRKLACDIPEPHNGNALTISQEVVPLRIADEESEPRNTISTQVSMLTPVSLSSDHIIIEGGGISITCNNSVPISLICSVIQALRSVC